ncbi:MAG: hypothetical protein IPK97_20805 [Ahniella sp.]|nr:hypothetical protein [Ahniella sp.]
MTRKIPVSPWPTLLLPLAMCCVSAAHAVPTIPPSDPPICGTDPGMSSLCEIELIYSLANCGDEDIIIEGHDGDINTHGYASTCGYNAEPIVPYIQCRTIGEVMKCEGYPMSTPELSYSWAISGPLRVHRTDSDAAENDRLIALTCAIKQGLGSLSLTIINPTSGTSLTTTVPVKCVGSATGFSGAK